MSRVPIIALALCLGLPSLAAAQDFPVALASVTWNGGADVRTSQVDLGRPFNAEMCANPADVQVVIGPSNPATGDLNGWLGTGTLDCSDTSNRNTNPSDSTCESLGIFGPVFTDTDGNRIETTLAEMGGSAIDPCSNTSSTGADYRLYLFATTVDPYLDEADLVDWGFLGSQVGFSWYTVDTQAPPPPVIDQEHVQGRNPQITWSTQTGNEPELTYILHIDRSGACCSDGDPTDCDMADAGMVDAGPVDGGMVDGGAGGPDGGSDFITIVYDDTSFRTSANIPLEDSDLSPGDTVTIYLQALDLARNVSGMSNATCATYVETGDFCSISGECGDLCNCSAPGAARGNPLWPLAVLPIFGLWCARRRRPL